MVRIEHVALWVSDLDKMCSFYADTFGAQIGPLYVNPKKGFSSRFLSFSDGARVELMTTTTLEPAAQTPGALRMGLTHLAISLSSEALVTETTAKLQSLGVTVLDGPRRTGDGYFESVILDPEGNRLELTA